MFRSPRTDDYMISVYDIVVLFFSKNNVLSPTVPTSNLDRGPDRNSVIKVILYKSPTEDPNDPLTIFFYPPDVSGGRTRQ